MAVPTPRGVSMGPGGAPVPPELAGLLRAQLEEVADEVEAEVRRQVPEYARPADGTYREHLRAGWFRRSRCSSTTSPIRAARAPR